MLTAMLCIAAIVAAGDLLPLVVRVLIGLYGALALFGSIGPIGLSRGAPTSPYWYGSDTGDASDANVSFDYLDGDGDSGDDG